MTRAAAVCALLLLAVVGAAGASAESAGPPATSGFPHARHEGLFPSCRPCHEGAFGVDGALLVSATPATCAACHDGLVKERVAWQAGRAAPSNVRFDHARHVRGEGIACTSCHQPFAGAARMEVAAPAAERCLACHGVATHFAAGTRCATCHLPLSEAGDLSAERIAAFPAPENHAEPGFLSGHGAIAAGDPERCAVCHARETCATCHPNAGSLAEIGRLPSDARAALQARRIVPRWPRPPSHDEAGWPERHGAAPEQLTSCGSCHVRESCEACHGARFQAAEALPAFVAGGPAGALPARARPPDHDAWFAREHGAAAATAGAKCSGCHASTSCSDCHEAASSPKFHGPNFLSSHAAEAFSRESDCSGCHSTEAFCRDCHATSGLSPADSRTSVFHDSQPFWLLNHGAAARQGLEGCAACHQQTDCLRCHSAKSGFRIDPHGPDFEPHALGDRNLAPCSVCHFSDPRP